MRYVDTLDLNAGSLVNTFRASLLVEVDEDHASRIWVQKGPVIEGMDDWEDSF